MSAAVATARRGATPRGASSRTAGVRRERHHLSYPLLTAVLALVAIGVVMVYSASSVQSYLLSSDPSAQGMQQAIWAVLGLGAMLLASRTDFRLLRYLAIPFYIVTLGLLVAVLIPGIGTEAFGSRRWIVIPGIGSFQPAELAKLAICIYLAHWLDRRGTQARSFWNGFVPFGLLVAPGFLLIALEPDLGTAGVYAVTALSIFFMAGANLVYLGAIAAGVIGAAVVMISSTPYQLERIRTFLDPFRDPLDAGYNTIQALLALALGGVVGQGLGASRMKYLYLPAPSTDFIFAIIGEEWGLLGTLTVLILFAMLAYHGYRIAINAPDTFSGLLAAGITTWLVVQACINMMVVTALMPVTGIPLPFISYGGSALTLNLVAVGILLSISRETTRHVYPALAVARALRDAQPGLELAYVGGVRGLERRIVTARADLAYHELVVRSLRSGGINAHLVLDPVRLAAAVPQAWALLGRLQPQAVFTSGGYLGIPLVMAARARGIPSLVWEGNVVAGRATAAVGRLATRVAVSFPPTLATFPGRAFVSGTPIRAFAGTDRAAARMSFGVPPDDRLLLVFGGSQAVARITDALDASLERLLVDWHVLHIAGDAGLAAAQATRARLPGSLAERYRPVAYLTDRMTDALVASDLVLGRAGSSTCAEVTAVGVASILVPYPYAGAHQRANAAYLADRGAAALVPDEALDADRLLAEATRLRDDASRARMAAAAAALGRPHAAETIAAELLAMGDGRPLPSLAGGAA